MDIAISEFRARPGAGFGNRRARVYGEELRRLAAESVDGALTPQLVVAAAVDPDSPLHERFTWDDDEAADKYRLVEARRLLNRIIVVATVDGHPVEQRAFFNVFVRSAETPPRMDLEEIVAARERCAFHPKLDNRYVVSESAANDVCVRRQIVAAALGELNRWRARYSSIEEFGRVCAMIAEEAAKLAPGTRTRKSTRSRELVRAR